MILGAGLTGLSIAYHLEQKGYYDFKIFEKESSVGGLCRSISQDGFTFDYTGHLLHINDLYVKNFVQELVGFEHFNTIERRSFIYSHNTYTPYPFQINLHGLPHHVIVECIEKYINRPRTNYHPKTFYSWVLKSFGEGLGKHFFFPYQKKIFDYDVQKLTASWTGRFVPSTSLQEMLYGALAIHKNKNIGYNSEFLYPIKGGIFSWVHALHQTLTTPVQTDHTIVKIDIKNKIIVCANGHTEPYKQIISTIPLDIFIQKLQEPSSSHISRAQRHLLCTKVININMGISIPELSDKHWVYYPESEYPFYRIGFSHNFSPYMAPKDCSSLYGEISYINADSHKIAQLTIQARRAIMQLFHLRPADIVTEKIIPISHAYVIYNAWRDRNISRLLQTLESYDLFTCGRYAEWKYSSMQEAILDGKKIADRLLFTPSQTDQKTILHQSHSNQPLYTES